MLAWDVCQHSFVYVQKIQMKMCEDSKMCRVSRVIKFENIEVYHIDAMNEMKLEIKQINSRY